MRNEPALRARGQLQVTPVFDLLKGVTVVDLTTVVLGPYATQLLADMGAKVIKVEPKGGDVFRGARPGRDGGDGAGFLNLNRNKRSIALDLAESGDKSILFRLIDKADVFVHNLRDESASKLGIGYREVSDHKQNIVYCSARGFGRGPYGDAPAYDDCIQAASGLAWLNADEQGEPRYVRTVLCDKIAGLHLAFAVVSGVAARERTGDGCHIEAPMFESLVSFLLIEQLSGQTFIPPLPDRGYIRLNAASRRPYRTRDGYVAIMPYTAAQWVRFLSLSGRNELAEAEWIRSDEIRSVRIEELYEEIERVAPQMTSAAWLQTLRENDIPCAPVTRLEDLPKDKHLVETEYFGTMSHASEGDLMYARSPFAVHTASEQPDRAAPTLDADRDDILTELARISE